MTVDEALAWACSLDSEDRDYEEIEALAAEVRRLREWVNATTTDGRILFDRARNAEAELERVSQQYFRVEALSKRWVDGGHRKDMTFEDAGYELLETLRGDHDKA